MQKGEVENRQDANNVRVSMPSTQERAAEIARAILQKGTNRQMLELKSQIITGQSFVNMRILRRTKQLVGIRNKGTNAKTNSPAIVIEVKAIQRVRDTRFQLHNKHNGGTTVAL